MKSEVRNLYHALHSKQNYTFGNRFDPLPPPKTPEVKAPFLFENWGPHEITAGERSVPTETTLAVHTLNGSPLQQPHGKKMVSCVWLESTLSSFAFALSLIWHNSSPIVVSVPLQTAKELGVWYGFRSSLASEVVFRPQAGYYHRAHSHRRYLWLDGKIGNTYSFVESNKYHDKRMLEWTMATLIAMAWRTNRILILPKIIQADSDAGIYFPWTLVDYSNVEDLVDFRETNFPSNPKSWHDSETPFRNVAVTAFLVDNITLYAEVTDDEAHSHNIFREAWTAASLEDSERMEMWLGSLIGVPEIDSAELLLVNPDVIDASYLRTLTRRSNNAEKLEHLDSKLALSNFEKDIVTVHGLLRWCYDNGFRHTASKASASSSCFGKGT
jgi:hypothetical protein